MARYYFSSDNEENCHTLDCFLEQLGGGCDEITIYPAIMLTRESFFFCQKYSVAGEVGDGCGKECKGYSPRNGKNGRCRYSQNCYEPDYSKPKILK